MHNNPCDLSIELKNEINYYLLCEIIQSDFHSNRWLTYLTYRIIRKMLHLTCLASNFLPLSHSHLAQGQSSKDLEIFYQSTVQKPEDFVRPVLSSTYQEKKL